MEDYWVPGKTNEELEQMAEELYSLINPHGLDNFDVYQALEKASFVKKLHNIKVIPQPDAILNKAYAYSTGGSGNASPKIFVRQSVYEGLKSGRARDRMTLAHELGHLYVHPQEAAMCRMADGNAKSDFIPPFNSAEHQASYFGGALLMPRAVVQNYRSAEELARGCGVSLQAARIRWEQIVERTKSREIPSAAKHQIAEIKALARPVPAPRLVSAKEQLARDDAWDNAKNATARDPSLYRLCVDGHPVLYTEYESNGICGWYVYEGAVYSYEGARRRLKKFNRRL